MTVCWLDGIAAWRYGGMVLVKTTIRLSEEQHETLRQAAFDSRRSLQKEIVARLFPALTGAAGMVSGEIPEPSSARTHETPAVPVSADSQPRDVPTRTLPQRDFQPDFKKGKK